ncbi:MAG: hypothetical protein INF89_15655 [Roseomonas sp.]|nr:hypothetical protein [Roseomonas sp.]
MPGPIRRLFPSAADQRRAAEQREREEREAVEKKEREEQEAAKKKELDEKILKMQRRREADKIIEDIKKDCEDLESERQNNLAAARRALAAGDRDAAERHVSLVRDNMVDLKTLDTQLIVFRRVAKEAKIAGRGSQMTVLMGGMAQDSQVDPALIESVMQRVRASIDLGSDTRAIWTQMSDDIKNGLGVSSSSVPTAKKLLEDLSAEVAKDIREGPNLAGAAPTDGAVKQRIGEGRARLTRLVEDLK